MKAEKQETGLKLTNVQLQKVITSHLMEEKGLNDLFSMLVNGLMYSERQAFLSQEGIDGNKGNGYRQATRSGIGAKLQLSIPRDRLGVFKPVILGLLDQQDDQIKELCFELYGKGMTTRQIEGIIGRIYGTHYSKSSISRITTDFSALVESWLSRPLENYYPVVYIDAIHIKVRRDTVSTEAFYVLLGLKKDFTREVLGIVNIPQESASGWREVLCDIRDRGVEHVGLFVSDDLKGLDKVIGEVFSSSKHQRCILHFQRNLYKNIRKSDRVAFSEEVKSVFNPDDPTYSQQQAIINLRQVIGKWAVKYPKLIKSIEGKAPDDLFTYLAYDRRVRRMLYTTNWIERLNKSFRRTLKMRNALPHPSAAITLLGFVAMEMEEGTYSYPINNFKFEEKLCIIE